MARAALHWTRARLAHEAGVGAATIQRFEGGHSVQDITVAAIEAALVQGGAVFIGPDEPSPPGGVGVRLAGN